jgi:hypothetical protein
MILVVFPCTTPQQATRFIEHCGNYKNNHVQSHQTAKQVQKLIHFDYVFHSFSSKTYSVTLKEGHHLFTSVEKRNFR